MKRLAFSAVLFSAIAFLISACASHDEGSSSQSTGNVPGERVSDEGSLTPGAAGSSATVHWWSWVGAATNFPVTSGCLVHREILLDR